MDKNLLPRVNALLPRRAKGRIQNETGKSYTDVVNVLRGSYVKWDILISAINIIENENGSGENNLKKHIESYIRKNLKKWK